MILSIFAENCMKIKKVWPTEGGGAGDATGKEGSLLLTTLKYFIVRLMILILFGKNKIINK